MNKMPLRTGYGETIYDGFDLEIMVSSTCNLNCESCDHWAPIAKEWFLTLPQLNKDLDLLLKTDVIDKIKKIILIGGEPFLNKDILLIIDTINKRLPKKPVLIISNGLLLNTINLKKLSNLYCHISITTYPVDFDYEKLKCKLNDYNISNNFLHSRVLFERIVIDPKGTQDLKLAYQCDRHRLPTLTLKESKIYLCPTSMCIPEIVNLNKNIKIDFNKNNFLKLEDLNLQNLDIFCNQPKDICKYCDQTKKEATLWSLYDKNNQYHYQYSLKDYFLKDYDTYEKIINNKKNADLLFKDKDFIERVDIDFYPYELYKNIYRYELSKIDIIIPYYRINFSLMEQLKETLLKQTLIKECVIYLISDNSPEEEEVFNFFSNVKELNCVFLKNKSHKGPGEARNIGLKNSYGKYVYFLDCDDEFVHENDLFNLYYFLEKNNLDGAFSNVLLNEFNIEKEYDMIHFIFRREFLIKNKIFYPSLYINEDEYFLDLFNSYEPKVNKVDYIFYKYNRSSFSESIGLTIKNKFLHICAMRYYLIIDLINRNKIHHAQYVYRKLIKGENAYSLLENDCIFEELTKEEGKNIIKNISLLLQEKYPLINLE